jgi:hypothetical protein
MTVKIVVPTSGSLLRIAGGGGLVLEWRGIIGLKL